MTKTLVVLAFAGCSKSHEPPVAGAPAPSPNPAAAATPSLPSTDDPWSAKAAPAPPSDPWSANPPPVEVATDEPPAPTPQPRIPPPTPGPSSLAGSFQCQQIRYNTATRTSSYVSSALGVFEVDGDGAYRSASYPTKGTGRLRAAGANVAFDGGAYAGSVGLAGTTAAGSFFIRFSGNLTDAPAPSMRFNDHMCYRK